MAKTGYLCILARRAEKRKRPTGMNRWPFMCGRGGMSIRIGLENRRPNRGLWVQIPPPAPKPYSSSLTQGRSETL